MTEEQLDVALSKICMAFDTNAYAEIQVANNFIFIFHHVVVVCVVLISLEFRMSIVAFPLEMSTFLNHF